MSLIYSIRDWSTHFENNRTRELKELRFVIFPNRHDGDGYTELLDHPNGAAHYGAWCAIAQVASKGQHPAGGCGNPAGCCECRGILLREGARAHDSRSLSRLTRIPAAVFDEALPRLVSIGWLISREPEVKQDQPDGEIPQDVGRIPQGGAEKCGPRARARNRTEQNGMEQKGRQDAPFDGAGFIAALDEFEQHRKEIRHKVTPLARRKLYAQFAAWGEEKSIRALNLAIRNGWRGVFDPDGAGGNGNGIRLSKAERSQQAGKNLIARYEREEREDRESAANH